jgi:hypothetical protein
VDAAFNAKCGIKGAGCGLHHIHNGARAPFCVHGFLSSFLNFDMKVLDHGF